ncbi:MAG: response regulator [Patescibacteria group bacterium]
MSESRRRLLLVDDVPQLRRAYIRVVQTVLARTGVVAEEAEDGCAALEVVKSGLHDSWCIISDVDMPHMTGLSLFAELSAISPPIRAHKILVSSLEVSAAMVEECGADRFLLKDGSRAMHDAISAIVTDFLTA